jgi:hypothetical protein
VPPYYRAPGPDIPQAGSCIAGHEAAVTWVYGSPDLPRRICAVHLLRFIDKAWHDSLKRRLFGESPPPP